MAARGGNLARRLEQLASRAGAAAIRVERQHLEPALGGLVDRGEADPRPVELGHEAGLGERVEDLAEPSRHARALVPGDESVRPFAVLGQEVADAHRRRGDGHRIGQLPRYVVRPNGASSSGTW